MQAVFVIYYYNTCIMSILDNIEDNLTTGSIEVIKQHIFNTIIEDAYLIVNIPYKSNHIIREQKRRELKTIIRNLFDTITVRDLIDSFDLSVEDIEVLHNNNVIFEDTSTTTPITELFIVQPNIRQAIYLIKNDSDINILDHLNQTYYIPPITIVSDKSMMRCDNVLYYSRDMIRGRNEIKIHENVAQAIEREIKSRILSTRLIFSEEVKNEFEQFLKDFDFNKMF